MIEFLIRFSIGALQIACGIWLYVCLKGIWDISSVKLKRFYKRNKRRLRNWFKNLKN
jgi:hypothetical protein